MQIICCILSIFWVLDEDDVAQPPLFTGFQARVSNFEPLIIHQKKSVNLEKKGLRIFLLSEKDSLPIVVCWLPYRRPVFCIWHGSFIPCVPPDFRTGGLFSAFRTEVSFLTYLLTSVPEARFLHLARKFHSLRTSWLPYRRPVFCIWHGSFIPCVPPDFRT